MKGTLCILVSAYGRKKQHPLGMGGCCHVHLFLPGNNHNFRSSILNAVTAIQISSKCNGCRSCFNLVSIDISRHHIVDTIDGNILNIGCFPCHSINFCFIHICGQISIDLCVPTKNNYRDIVEFCLHNY